MYFSRMPINWCYFFNNLCTHASLLSPAGAFSKRGPASVSLICGDSSAHSETCLLHCWLPALSKTFSLCLSFGVNSFWFILSAAAFDLINVNLSRSPSGYRTATGLRRRARTYRLEFTKIRWLLYPLSNKLCSPKITNPRLTLYMSAAMFVDRPIVCVTGNELRMSDSWIILLSRIFFKSSLYHFTGVVRSRVSHQLSIHKRHWSKICL